MRIRGAMSGVVMMGLALAGRARADEPPGGPAVAPTEPAEVQTIPATPASAEPSVEPAPVPHPPWSGREAIWGGVGLAIAGAATLIVALPAACYTPTHPTATCIDATVIGGASALGLGGILLIVGQTQRASYKEWLKRHPMFAGATVAPSVTGFSMGYTATF